MINLLEFKEKAAMYFHRIMIEVMHQDVVEICDRAIAAESKLADADLLISKWSESFSALSKDYFELKSKLAEMERQGSDVTLHIRAGVPISVVCKNELCSGIHDLYLHAKPAESVQRITEQDAREIVNSFNKWFARTDLGLPGLITDFDKQVTNLYLSDEGRTLLAKLNEHREPEVKAEVSIDTDKAFEDYVKLMYKGGDSDEWHDAPVSEVFKDGFNLGRQVTANKAEVPTLVRENLRRIANWFGEFPRVVDAIGETSYGVAYGSNGERDYMRNLAKAALDSLPPLKDGAQ